jgi:hypothetical protein
MHVNLLNQDPAHISAPMSVGMIGYLPPREPDEMAYSVVARASAILFPRDSSKYVCEHLLGNRDLTVGGLLPNNGWHLAMRAPRVAKVCDEFFLDGSIYHILAPLLCDAQRNELRRSILEENARGRRGLIRRPGIRGILLRYCVVCARRDRSNGQSQTWRVVPNFPGVNCCPEHGCLLQVSEASLEPDRIRIPSEWINPDLPLPGDACAADQRFADDVRWLYERKSVELPGRRRLNAALRKVLMGNPRYCVGKGRLSAQRIAADLCRTMEATVTRLDPTLLSSAWKPTLSMDVVYPLARYSLLAQLVGIRLRDVFVLAASEPIAAPDEQMGPLVAKSARVANARQKLAQFVADNPRAGRKQIKTLNPSAVCILRRNDLAAYEELMPARIRRGRNSSFDWAARDRDLHEKISGMEPVLGPDARSATRILMRCGIPKRLVEKARGRLPRSHSLLCKIVDAWSRAHDPQTYFYFYKSPSRFHRESRNRAKIPRAWNDAPLIAERPSP